MRAGTVLKSCDPGIVDEDVHLRMRLGQLRPGVFPAHVEHSEIAANLTSGFPAFVLVDVGKQNLGAFAQECFANASPDPACAPCNYGRLPRKPAHAILRSTKDYRV